METDVIGCSRSEFQTGDINPFARIVFFS